MSVGAALKKVTTEILSNPKWRKKALEIGLIGLVILAIPVGTIAVLCGGNMEIDAEQFQASVVQDLTVEERRKLLQIEKTMENIASAMQRAGYDKPEITEAQVLYVLALSDYSNQTDFVDKLVCCFQKDQTDTQLIAAINAAFRTDIAADEFSMVMDSIRAVRIDVSRYTDPATKNNLDLVQWVRCAQRQGWGYVLGTFGYVLDQSLLTSKIKQYPEEIGKREAFIRANWLGKRTVDCIGLIKGYGWLDPVSLQIGYETNGMPDIDADAMFRYATEKGSINTIPEIPGLAVWFEGHIGVYVGEGKVIEAKGTQYGVVETKLSEGLWTHWLKIPYITYITPNEVKRFSPDAA